MKILHISDDGLPDWRVEKSALTAKKAGHELFFAGRLKNRAKYTIFSEVHRVNWTAGGMVGIPYYYHRVKKQIEKLVNQIRPDIVHAHNIGSAKISYDLGLPAVFDNHEYFAMLSRVNAENIKIQNIQNSGSGYVKFKQKMKLSFISRQSISNWTKWEKELVLSVPTITVSEQIAQELQKLTNEITKKIIVIPNFPLQEEQSSFNNPQQHGQLSSVYAGGDSKYKKVSNRDISGLTDLFMLNNIGNLTIIGWEEPEIAKKFKATGFLPRDEMFSEMIQHSVGLIPWKKHWSHPFLNPNKAYEYAHAGLFVMLTSDMKSVITILGDNCLTFEDYDDLASKLEYFKSNPDELFEKRLKIFNFARINLVWEKHEKKILDAYKLS
ncbi:MAG TPA: glycosyltransferase [Nitrososphaeraceae archaeon]|nr:glycosyltransferase [Nitrososphaeraceae archaeon]